VGGFVLAGLLAAWGARRLRDEEIPQVALLAAAFFVASLLHVRLGPTSVHLLLNGLVGLVLGRRAAVAIPLGLFLQAAIPQHGGFTTLGVNACVMTVPALLAGWLFAELHHSSWLKKPALRAVLVAGGTLAGSLGAVVLVVAVATNRWDQWMALDLTKAFAAAGHPATLGVAAALALMAAWAERHWRWTPEFTLGLLVGATAVLATVTLNALVLLLGGNEDWHQVVTAVLLAHLPLVPLEGVIVGFTATFLARVKPELLGSRGPGEQGPCPAPGLNGTAKGAAEAASPPTPGRIAAGPPALLLALAALLLAPGSALAHRLRADWTPLPDGRVQVESWFDIGNDSPAGADVRVFGEADRLVTEGKLSPEGVFVFSYAGSEPLRVVVSAGGGHRGECLIPAGALASPPPAAGSAAQAANYPRLTRQTDVSPKDVLLGVTFLLALAAFVLSVRNARRLR
jgi:cobalt/nickel transport system permease protein